MPSKNIVVVGNVVNPAFLSNSFSRSDCPFLARPGEATTLARMCLQMFADFIGDPDEGKFQMIS